jgi:transposase
MEEIKRAPRRKHDAGLKAQVLRECAQAGASVAAVALAHGLNANLVHKWRRWAAGNLAELAQGSNSSGQFVELALSPEGAEVAPQEIRIEVRRGATAMSIHWPVHSSAECGCWLREWLK